MFKIEITQKRRLLLTQQEPAMKGDKIMAEMVKIQIAYCMQESW